MAQTIQQIATKSIRPDPNNPRGQLSDDDQGVKEFAQQLRENKTIYQPLRLVKDGEGYRIVIGERRWRAARLAGLRTVPAIVEGRLSAVEVREQQLAEMAQQNEVPTHRQYEAWADYVRTLTTGGLSRSQAIGQVARLVGKSVRTISSTIGPGYVEAPPELKQMVEKGVLGPAVVGLLNAAGLERSGRVKLARKIASGVIKTTGTTIQSELMPRIRKGDEIAQRLINDQHFTLEDARRLELAKSVAAQEEERRERLRRAKESARERPRTMADITLELEEDFLRLTSKLRSLNEVGLVEDLRLSYLRSTLRLFAQQWSKFAGSLPVGYLDARSKQAALKS